MLTIIDRTGTRFFPDGQEPVWRETTSKGSFNAQAFADETDDEDAPDEDENEDYWEMKRTAEQWKEAEHDAWREWFSQRF